MSARHASYSLNDMTITVVKLLWCVVLCLQNCFMICHALHQKNPDIKVLNVGEELERETLPLKMGQRIYHVYGLKEARSYEVKISYPASIPTRFSLQLKRNVSEFWLNKNRRLLNTEKEIFNSDGHTEVYVLVTVDAAGIVAKPNVRERKVVLFNIVCDELAFGIPYKALWVGSTAIVCLILAAIIAYLFPPHVLVKLQRLQSGYSTTKAT